ncbi:hypothetical protein Tco_0499711 [Tanacetum coccineum]
MAVVEDGMMAMVGRLLVADEGRQPMVAEEDGGDVVDVGFEWEWFTRCTLPLRFGWGCGEVLGAEGRVGAKCRCMDRRMGACARGDLSHIFMDAGWGQGPGRSRVRGPADVGLSDELRVDCLICGGGVAVYARGGVWGGEG